MILRKLLLPILVLALLVSAGCIFSPDDDNNNNNTPPPPRYVFPDTPEKLMDNFEIVYEEMDIDAFRTMLHPDYLTILQPSTTALYPDVGDYLELSEELTIHENMFSGNPGTGPNGEFAPGIVDIQFQILEQTQPFAETTASDIIPNAEFSLYEVVFLFDRGEGHTLLRVQGQIKFYVSSRDSVVAGETKPFYQMRGQQDLTQSS